MALALIGLRGRSFEGPRPKVEHGWTSGYGSSWSPARRRTKRPGKKRGLGDSPRPRQTKRGGDLLSHPVSRAVPSAQEGLTSLFGMGRGVSPPPKPPQYE